MTFRKTLTTLTSSAVLALSFSTTAKAGGHNDYVNVENCAWYDTFCKIQQTANRYNTKYPIVLVHGLTGFDDILFVEYFHGITDELRDGNADVYIPNLSSWNGIEIRGEQLVDYIQNHVLPASGASKVNLIGHSMGSPTARYVASVHPELVASVTSAHGSNSGSHFADFMLNSLVPEGNPLHDAYISFVTGLLSEVGFVIDYMASGESFDQDAYQASYDLSTQGAAEFNAIHSAGQPTTQCGSGAAEVDGIRYYSWGGDGGITNVLDPFDYVMVFIRDATANGTDTDGLVGRCEQRWGHVLRDDYNHNHFDGTNQLFGMTGLTDPKDIYENQANRLRDLGL